MIKLVSLLVLLAALGGCAHVNSVSLTPVPSQRTQPVRAEVSKIIILGLSFDNDFIDPLVDDLKSQCRNGVISGILTKDETINYILVFKKKVTATGYCNVATARNSNNGKSKPARSAASEAL